MHLLIKTVSPLFKTLSNARVLKDFLMYSCGSLMLRAIALFIVPFIMRVLTPADYGALSLVTAFITISTALIGMGLRQVLSIEYFHHDAHGQKQLVNEILVIYTVIALPIILLAWQFHTYINQYIFFNTISDATLAGALCSIFFFFYAELLYQIMQYHRQVVPLTIIQLSVACITLLTTFITVWIFHLGIAGVVWAQAGGQIYAAGIGIILYCMYKYQIYRNSKTALCKLASHLKIGLPFIPGIISSWILASSDRWMLGYYSSMNNVGIYAIADLFAQLFNALVLVPWSGSYLPYILQRYKTHKDEIETIKQENQRTMWMSLSIGAGCITIGTILGMPLFRWILPASYHQSLSYVWILMMGQLFLLGSYFASTIIQYRKRTLFLAVALALPACINIMLNTMLIKPFDILGCSLATLLSYLAYFLLTLLYQKTSI